MSKKNIIYILPHHDDEMFVIPKITHDLKSGHNIKFFFLMQSDLRLAESRKFLAHIGVSNDNIISVGQRLSVSDGSVHIKVEEIYQFIMNALKEGSTVDEIVCTAYEGGHNDHDVASMIARAIAKLFNNSTVLEFFLYNGHGTRGKFYKVAHPVNLQNTLKLKYSIQDFYFTLKAPFFYSSQLSAMLGLWPFLMLKVIIFKPLTLAVLERQNLKLSAHFEAPLYERWGRIDQKYLLSNTEGFLYTHGLISKA